MPAIILGRPFRRLLDRPVRLRCRVGVRSLHRLVAISIVSGTFIVVLAGCQQGRLMTPLARHRALDSSPPSMHGPSMARSAHSRDSQSSTTQKSTSQVQVTSENAVPETDIEPVEQRLATTRQVARRTSSGKLEATLEAAPVVAAATTRKTMSELAGNTPGQSTSESPASAPAPHLEEIADGEIAQASASVPIEPPQKQSFVLPQVYSGVDVRDLLAALENAPPEFQQAAVAKLIALSRSRARETGQPLAIDDALAAAFDELPQLPTVVPDRDVKPSRIGISQPPADVRLASAQEDVAKALAQTKLAALPTIQQASLESIQEPTLNADPKSNVSELKESAVVTNAPDNITQSDQKASPQNVSMSLSDSSNGVAQQNTQDKATGAATLSDGELFNALVLRLQKTSAGESDAERHRRQVVARHLMVLSGEPDRAVDQLEGLSEVEAQYLRHQLLGLWKIVDPNGHPVPSHRFSSALPEIRKATKYLAAASDSLEVRALEFCTEIESYGQIKPFPNRRFVAGQEVILYCEIDNFVSNSVEGGFETRLRGSYDLLDANGERIASQSLPEDHQTSKNNLRDYFIAYQMYLPEAVDPGRYQLRLTMEDVHGKKYGQATVDFEIKR